MDPILNDELKRSRRMKQYQQYQDQSDKKDASESSGKIHGKKVKKVASEESSSEEVFKRSFKKTG